MGELYSWSLLAHWAYLWKIHWLAKAIVIHFHSAVFFCCITICCIKRYLAKIICHVFVIKSAQKTITLWNWVKSYEHERASLENTCDQYQPCLHACWESPQAMPCLLAGWTMWFYLSISSRGGARWIILVCNYIRLESSRSLMCNWGDFYLLGFLGPNKHITNSDSLLMLYY